MRSVIFRPGPTDNNRSRRSNKSLLYGALIFVCIAYAPAQTQSTDALIRKAEETLSRARYETQRADDILAAIELYEQALATTGDNSEILNTLSKGYFVLGDYFRYDRESAMMQAFQRGYDYALRSLRLNATFDASYREGGLEKALTRLSSVSNAKAVFWAGSNLGKMAEYEETLKQAGKIDALVSLLERTLELDETFLEGGPHRAMGALNAVVSAKGPITTIHRIKYNLGWNNAKKHFERAIEIAPDFLDNYYYFARYYAVGRNEYARAQKYLEIVRDTPVGEEYPMINAIVKQKAELLLERIENSRR